MLGAVPVTRLFKFRLAELAEPREAERVAQGRIDGLAPPLQTPVYPEAMQQSVGLGVEVAVVVVAAKLLKVAAAVAVAVEGVSATPDFPATRLFLTAVQEIPVTPVQRATPGRQATHLRRIACQ